MSEKHKKQIPMNPTAPPNNDMFVASEFSQRAPPPTYEQSQKMSAAVAPQQLYGAMQAPTSHLPPYGTGYVNPYQTHMQQHQHYYHQPMPMSHETAETKVITLAKGAEVRHTVTGAISIPPPPPGYAATPAQLAAMNGQPVVVKKKKNTFF
ncbi:DAZ-associated protein 2 isoform X2 [Teleopsis dalmanni]|uniref:DAZ-associated protein 2 isoform X2 n=1 Tax=Teleopsis dalmanni TaxID=139649 RepID=UPI0018CCA394|nr:DAZ-associated protein 2 isoform X2 [Teleopsis dalmanni]